MPAVWSLHLSYIIPVLKHNQSASSAVRATCSRAHRVITKQAVFSIYSESRERCQVTRSSSSHNKWKTINTRAGCQVISNLLTVGRLVVLMVVVALLNGGRGAGEGDTGCGTELSCQIFARELD